MTTQDFAGKTVLITGANGGIGTALTLAFRQRGAKVIAGVRSDTPLYRDDDGIEHLQLDVTIPQSVSAAAAKCARRVDILINNAGVNTNSPALSASDTGNARREMEVNYFGTLAMLRAFTPAMKEKRSGIIGNILSSTCLSNLPIMATYSASKAALFSLTQATRAELSPYGIHVCAIIPSIVDSGPGLNVRAPHVKLSTQEVAIRVVEGLQLGLDEILIGATAELLTDISTDRKKVEREMAARYHAKYKPS